MRPVQPRDAPRARCLTRGAMLRRGSDRRLDAGRLGDGHRAVGGQLVRPLGRHPRHDLALHLAGGRSLLNGLGLDRLAVRRPAGCLLPRKVGLLTRLPRRLFSRRGARAAALGAALLGGRQGADALRRLGRGGSARRGGLGRLGRPGRGGLRQARGARAEHGDQSAGYRAGGDGHGAHHDCPRRAPIGANWHSNARGGPGGPSPPGFIES